MASSKTPAGEGLKTFFAFPHPVNEYAARTVASMVFALGIAIVVTETYWLIVLLTYGFAARVLAGPRLSPFGWIATRVIVPLVIKRNKQVAGPPKQFAQAIGLVFSATSLILVYAFGFHVAANWLLSVLIGFAGLEAAFGFCAGCFVFGWLIRLGLIPQEICQRCADLNFGPAIRDKT